MGRQKREPVEVKVGQIWTDNHPRRKGRCIRVIEVGPAYALADPWTDYADHTYYGSREIVVIRPTRILLDRLNSSAWTFTGEVVEVKPGVYKGDWTTADLNGDRP